MAVLTIGDTSEIKDLTEDQRKEVAKAAMISLPSSEAKKVLSELGLPSQQTTDRLYQYATITIALVLLTATGVLGWAFIFTDKVDAGSILALFTAGMGFVSGLFIKSPVA